MGVLHTLGQGKYNGTEEFIRWTDVPEAPSEVAITPTNPASGWWLVVQISWHNEAEQFGMSRTAYFAAQCAGTMAIWIVCWYQLQDGAIVIQAWPVFLINPSCM